MTNLDIARHYLKSIEAGDAESVLSLFSLDASVEQLPNRIYPQGLRTSISEIPAAFDKGRKIFARQIYEITNTAVTGNLVALEALWDRHVGDPVRHACGGQRDALSLRHVPGIPQRQDYRPTKL
jgi:hypothetical protein